ncbi:SRPBCC family protein [Actinoplanes sp. G11-F43]|uniref:SRPBCC family protein n=1 Tax=Actinoplanes sp. G11-F43 TaxID=3424130 RepID=UPI003D334D13
MKITNEFTVQIPIDQAWKVFTDLEGIAPCMPGAQLTGVEGEVYKGKVKIKVGPVISDFSGTAQFTAKDDAAYRAVIDAKGRDARAGGNASATVTAFLTAVDATTTKVNVDTDLKISGKLAQFGSGMIKEVSSKLIAQFLTNLEKKLAADAAVPAPAATPAPTSTSTPGSTSTDAAPAASAPAPSVAAPAAAGAASAAAVDTVPSTAVAVGSTAADGSTATDKSDSTVVPDPSAGVVTPDAGRTAVAEGTPDPVAPLRTPDADLTAAPDLAATPDATPADAAPAAATSEAAPATTPVVATSGTSAAPAAAPVTKPAATATAERTIESEEPEPLDLLEVAGGSIYKRLIPVAVGTVLVVGAVIVWFVARG